jgi:hypothetical protein
VRGSRQWSGSQRREWSWVSGGLAVCVCVCVCVCARGATCRTCPTHGGCPHNSPLPCQRNVPSVRAPLGCAAGTITVPLSRPNHVCYFGRLPSCGVVLDHLSVSRRHASLTIDGKGGLFITDLAAAHGTNVDGAWVRPNVPRQLVVGSKFKFGASSREYEVVRLPEPVPG